MHSIPEYTEEDYINDCEGWWEDQLNNPDIDAGDYKADGADGAYIINGDELLIHFQPDNKIMVNGNPADDFTLQFNDKKTALAFIDMVNKIALKAGWQNNQ